MNSFLLVLKARVEIGILLIIIKVKVVITQDHF